MREELVPIGTFSILTGLSVAALRHYAELGLLVPADVDPRTGYRRYSRHQVVRARQIRLLRRFDLPLDAVTTVLDGDRDAARKALAEHREFLRRQRDDLEQKWSLVDDYLQKGMRMQGVAGVRLVALNLGVTSSEELTVATRFWSAVFGADFEDWGQGSLQLRLGDGDDFYLFNFRIRGSEEPQYGHNAAFGLLVEDLDDFHRRALAAGAKEHYPPSDADGMPRHSRIEDPVGNRVVVWQG